MRKRKASEMVKAEMLKLQKSHVKLCEILRGGKIMSTQDKIVSTQDFTIPESEEALSGKNSSGLSEVENETEARLNVERALNANHANTLPMLEILRAFEPGKPRAYREFEDEVYDLPVMNLSHQNAHTLSLMLVKCGALEQIFVEEETGKGACDIQEASDSEKAAASSQESVEAFIESFEDEPADNKALEDKPVDYLLAITPAGSAALETFEPTKRYGRMLAAEPDSYREVYKEVLNMCMSGSKIPDIEDKLETMEALHEPKRVYAGHFISNLETVAGITWDEAAGLWKTTESGKNMAAL